jgi:hypothetical protein
METISLWMASSHLTENTSLHYDRLPNTSHQSTAGIRLIEKSHYVITRDYVTTFTDPELHYCQYCWHCIWCWKDWSPSRCVGDNINVMRHQYHVQLCIFIIYHKLPGYVYTPKITQLLTFILINHYTTIYANRKVRSFYGLVHCPLLVSCTLWAFLTTKNLLASVWFRKFLFTWWHCGVVSNIVYKQPVWISIHSDFY